MARWRNVWVAIGAMAAALAVAALLFYQQLAASMEQRSAAPAGTRVTVNAGASLRTVLAELARVHALRDPRLVEWYLRLHGEHLRAQAGIYELASGATVRQILAQLAAGRVVMSQLTIVEGWSFAQMRQALDGNSDLEHDWQHLDEAALMSALGQRGMAAEGRFFPDTYRFAAGTSDRRIYELALRRMSERLEQQWAERAPGTPLRTADAALILASIVEKETGREDERAMVAAVFSNRLRQGMRLQSDPTVIYGLGSTYDGNLRRRDLEKDGPYNSYTRAGLPPTPIALPGEAALHATLHPATSDALYFVATGAGDGSHYFSATYAQHNAALAALSPAHRRASGQRRHGWQEMKPAQFITLEGIEGAGKSTIALALQAELEQRGIPLLLTREPGGTPLAERMRALLLSRETEALSPVAETLLMFAARAVHLDNAVRPALAAGRWVICDRFTDASYAYQGAGRGVSASLLDQLAAAVHADLWPARTLLLDVPVDTGLARARARAGAADRFEAERPAFFERVRSAYLQRAAADPRRIRVIDARLPAEQVVAACQAALADLWSSGTP